LYDSNYGGRKERKKRWGGAIGGGCFANLTEDEHIAIAAYVRLDGSAQAQ